MAAPKASLSPNSHSTGFSTRLVQIISISADGLTAMCADRSGYEVRVPMYAQRAKGFLPRAGEDWIVGKDVSQQDGWNFLLFIGKGTSDFQAGSADIAPGALNGMSLKDNPIVFEGSNGRLLGYSGSAAAGNLVLSAAPAAGTDSFTNAYPEGVQTDQLTITKGPAITGPQGMTVPGALVTFPGITVTQTSLHDLATATILANRAVANACFELEVNGNGTQATGTATTLQIGVALGGTDRSNQILGAAFCPNGGTFRWTFRVRATCVTAGAGGTWQTEVSGIMSQNANPNNAIPLIDCDSNTTLSKSTTVDQTLALRAAEHRPGPSLTSRVAIFKKSPEESA
jgi:hypothetical protein